MKRIPPVKVKIEHTYDYDKFKLIGINRNVDKKHVGNIANAIEARNLLHLFPLVINSKWEVFDGQHRLSSAKLIQSAKNYSLPLYYIMDPDITLDDICLLNDNKVNWKALDYINFFAGKGNKNYIELQEFINAYKFLPLSACFILCSSERRDITTVKAGQYKADHVEKAYYIMKCIMELKERMEPTDFFYKGTVFISAMKAVVMTKKYQHHVMLASERNNREHWAHNSTRQGYLIDIQKIYNYHLPEAQKVDFCKIIREQSKTVNK